jgi:chromatin segregation and condensation protein Rec8/ScpA/Scc1 (kleisin family)
VFRVSGGFQLSLPGFDGAVEDLPSIVSTRQLALDEISLAAIPSQFLAGTADGEMDLDQAGEVLSATARLMWMKSVYLLARPTEEDEDTRSLPARERDPGILEPALLLAERQGSASYPSAGRLDSVPRQVGTRPATGLVDAWKGMLARETVQRVRAALPSFVRLEVAISRIISRLSSEGEISFRRLVGRASREDAVMHFLGALELVRRGDVQARQEELFGDIQVGWAHDSQETADRAG